jgi:hypothetical protein
MKINLRGVTRGPVMSKFTKVLGIVALALIINIGAAVAAAVGVGAAVGGLTTITTNRVTAAGCAYGFCAMVIGWCSASGAAGNDQNT